METETKNELIKIKLFLILLRDNTVMNRNAKAMINTKIEEIRNRIINDAIGN